jgi:hypothetical protein
VTPMPSAQAIPGSSGIVACRSWMIFVDGENFTIRGQAVAEATGINLSPGASWRKDEFLWLPGRDPKAEIYDTAGSAGMVPLEARALRAYYYASVAGDDARLDELRELIWGRGFHPAVFKRRKDQSKAKGVDIALAKDFLLHAARDHYAAAILVTGDGDYVPLVNEVKAMGKVVILAFFEHPDAGLSPELRIAADMFVDYLPLFRNDWKGNPNG